MIIQCKFTIIKPLIEIIFWMHYQYTNLKMLRNKIYSNYLIEIFKTFFTIIFGLSLIALTVRSVNFLDLIVDNGYSLVTYFSYSFLNIFGIAPKFFPLAFLLAVIIFIIRHNNNNEFVILWTSGVKKIVIVNLLLLSSFIVVILYLSFSTLLTPFTLNKARLMLSQSQFNSFLPTIRSQQFSDSFKGITFFVEKKINNEIQNIFLHDTGNNLKNFSSNVKDSSNVTILAEKGIVENKGLFLINGEIITDKKVGQKSDIIKFEQLNINLGELNPTIIKSPKLQETSTLKLLSCILDKNIKFKFCNKDTIKEIIPTLIRRLVLPAYIPILALLCSILLFSKKKYFNNTIAVFLYCFVILVFSELLLKYTGSSTEVRYLYFLIPIITFLSIYPFLLYKFSK